MKPCRPLACLMFLVFLGVTSRAEERAFKFDFGWKELEPPKEFVKVTKDDIYSKDKQWLNR